MRASGSERRQRLKAVAVRLLPEEAQALDEAAERAGKSVGAYLRTVALGHEGLRAVRRPPIEKAELSRILHGLGKIGSNVNQLARVANATGAVAPFGELKAMHADLFEIRDAVITLLGRRP